MKQKLNTHTKLLHTMHIYRALKNSKAKPKPTQKLSRSQVASKKQNKTKTMFTKVYKLASFVRNSIIIDTYIRFKGALPRSDGATEHGNLTTFNLANFGSADVDAAAAGTGDSLPTSVEAARRPPPPPRAAPARGGAPPCACARPPRSCCI